MYTQIYTYIYIYYDMYIYIYTHYIHIYIYICISPLRSISASLLPSSPSLVVGGTPTRHSPAPGMTILLYYIVYWHDYHYLCMNVYIYIYTYIHMCIHMYICMYVCIHIYIYICTHIHIYTYIAIQYIISCSIVRTPTTRIGRNLGGDTCLTLLV